MRAGAAVVPAFLVAVGALGGTITSAGGIATLISYPALLAVGLPPTVANVTNAVAVVGTGLTSALTSRPELHGTGRRLPAWSLLGAAGALAGAVLLLVTPGDLFARVAPVLIASAALLLLVQPRISAWQAARTGLEPASWLRWGLLGVGVYDGYFGAASGIMLLAVLMLTVETRLTRANALKNTLLGISDAVAAVAFVCFGPVRWGAAIPLGLGFLAGGALGPRVARRLPSGPLRVTVALAGLGVAAWLGVSAFR